MSHYLIAPDDSQVWIEGSSSVHAINATATGLTGWVDVEPRAIEAHHTPRLAGEVRIAVDRLSSGNPLVDRETRRRINARRHPEIVGAVTGATGFAPNNSP